MPVGTVKWFDCKKGFGFIVNQAGQDVFVHFSSIPGEGFRALRDGEQVEYEQITGEKGLSARNVTRIVPLGAGGSKEGKGAATRSAASRSTGSRSTGSRSSATPSAATGDDEPESAPPEPADAAASPAAAEASPASIPTAAHVARSAASAKAPKL